MNDSGRYASNYCIGGHILCHKSTCTHDRSCSNRYALQDHGFRANPRIGANPYFCREGHAFIVGTAGGGVDWMEVSIVDSDTNTELHVILNGYPFGAEQDDAGQTDMIPNEQSSAGPVGDQDRPMADASSIFPEAIGYADMVTNSDSRAGVSPAVRKRGHRQVRPHLDPVQSEIRTGNHFSDHQRKGPELSITPSTNSFVR